MSPLLKSVTSHARRSRRAPRHAPRGTFGSRKAVVTVLAAVAVGATAVAATADSSWSPTSLALPGTSTQSAGAGSAGIDATSASFRRAAQWKKPSSSRGNPHHTATPSVPVTPTTTPTAAPTTSSPTPTASPTTSPAPSPAPTTSGWPDASTTGVPAGTPLTTYTGPCTVTTANTVIDAKTVNCSSLVIHAANVTISRSKVNGIVSSGTDNDTYSFTLSDSDVDATPGFAAQLTAVEGLHFTVLRSDIQGGNRSVNCINCTIQDSYVHGQDADAGGTWHESGIRMNDHNVIRHNTILCDAPTIGGAGCSADLTGYGDFAPVTNNLIENNLFKATPSGGFCSYGGSSKGKAYSTDAHDIRFINNVFEAGPTGHCGIWGPVTDFDPTRPGNLWSGNTWTDGTPAS